MEGRRSKRKAPAEPPAASQPPTSRQRVQATAVNTVQAGTASTAPVTRSLTNAGSSTTNGKLHRPTKHAFAQPYEAPPGKASSGVFDIPDEPSTKSGVKTQPKPKRGRPKKGDSEVQSGQKPGPSQVASNIATPDITSAKKGVGRPRKNAEAAATVPSAVAGARSEGTAQPQPRSGASRTRQDVVGVAAQAAA